MSAYSLYLLETGFSQELPGFKKDTATSIFPFWGNYYFLDFLCSQFARESNITIYLLIPEYFKAIASFIGAKWKSQIDQIVVLINEIEDFIDLVNRDRSTHIIVTSMSYISLFEAKEIMQLMDKSNSSIIKISIDNVPLDLFLVKRKELSHILRSYKKEKKSKLPLISFLFKTILHSHFESMEDISGKVFFHNSIMQLYEGNLWVINNRKHSLMLDFLMKQSSANYNGKGMYVSEHGHLKNSFISTGVEIEGYVENSIVFSNVVVQKHAQVVNSVIMNNNRIGKNAVIHNAIIFPFYEDYGNTGCNIAEGCSIGAKGSLVKNNVFPEQLYKGLTLIGLNVRIPKEFTIEPGVFLGPEYPLKQLKNLKILKKGTSIYIDTDMENKQS